MAWSWYSNILTVTDLDSSDVVDLGALSGLDAMGNRLLRWPAWSPDASRILVLAVTFEERSHLYVMDADGSDLRRLGVAGDAGDRPAWSPDGSLIASQRWMEVEPGSIDDRQASGSTDGCTWATWISVIDAETGAERDLETTRFNPGVAEPESGCPGIGGWSWSPDGRAILIHEEPGARPFIVEVETDTATDLPWESDSAPSWQRVAAD
jgi:Tol biopolymer transport system component